MHIVVDLVILIATILLGIPVYSIWSRASKKAEKNSFDSQ